MADTLPWEGRRPLSYSSISMYDECPQKYKFKYIDRIPEKPKHFFSYGRSVHDALEFFYNPELIVPPTIEELLKYFREHWVSEGYRDAIQEREKMKEGEDLLRSFFAKHEPDWAPPFHAEFGFNVEIAGVPVTGKIDRIDVLEDGTLSVLDYKTGKTFKRGRIGEDRQLSMYQLGVELAIGKTVSQLVLYHLPSLKEHVASRRPQTQLDTVSRSIRSTAQNILDAKFEPQPTETACRWCDFQALCPVFSSAPPASAPSEPAAEPAPAPAAATPQSSRTFGSPANVKERIAELVDRLGELEEENLRRDKERREVREELTTLLRENEYVRAFGKRHQVMRSTAPGWSFPDKEKFLSAVRDLALYEKILIPGAKKVQALLEDPQLDPKTRDTLHGLAKRTQNEKLELRRLDS